MSKEKEKEFIETYDANMANCSNVQYSIEVNTNDAFALNMKGNRLMQMKSYNEEIESFEKAIAIKPDFEDAFNGKGWTLFKMKLIH